MSQRGATRPAAAGNQGKQRSPGQQEPKYKGSPYHSVTNIDKMPGSYLTHKHDRNFTLFGTVFPLCFNALKKPILQDQVLLTAPRRTAPKKSAGFTLSFTIGNQNLHVLLPTCHHFTIAQLHGYAISLKPRRSVAEKIIS
jgi:hypothetical protein